METGDIVDAEEAERRVLMLVNPAMGESESFTQKCTSPN